MKKILLALLTLMSVISYSQTTGYLRYDSVRIMKAGANSNLIIENATRDSLGFLYNYGNGRTRFEVIRAVAGGIKVGEDTIIVGAGQGDFLIGGSVTPEGGFRFSVQEADYGLEGVVYHSDSATVFVDSADDDFDRFDAIYLDSDETVKILKGIPAENPAIPQLPSGTILLTVVSIEAGAIQANISTINVYFENDATITPSGTTAVGNSTAAPYAGTFHIRVSTINNGDYIDIIKPSGTWDISQQDFLSFHIKNRAVVPQLANLRASLWNGSCTGCQVSGEVILNYNKNNTTTYNAYSMPMAALGNITNTNIDRIRLRFTSNNANNFTGYDIDNVFFGANLQQPGGGTGQFTLNTPSSISITPGNTIVTNNSTYNLSFTGNSSQYVRGDGSLATFSAVTTVGAFGSQASNSNGLVISGVNIYGQPVTATEPGMTTPAMKASWDSVYTVEELSSLGYSIMVPIDAARTGFKRIVFDDEYKNTDSTIHLDTTGGGGGGSTLLALSGTNTATGNVIGDLDGNSLQIVNGVISLASPVTGGSNSITLDNGSDNLIISSDLGSDESGITLFGDALQLHSSSGFYTMTNLNDNPAATKVLVSDGGVIGTQDISGFGGGGSSLFPVTGTGTATGNVIGAMAGNNLSITGADTITLSGRIIGVGIDDVLAVGQQITGNKVTRLAPNAIFNIEDDLTPWLMLDNTEGVQAVRLICPNDDNTGYSELIMNANDDDGYKFKLESFPGVSGGVYIQGRGDDNTIHYVAPSGHTFDAVDGDVVLFLGPTAIEIGRATFPSITYTADTHTLNGAVRLAALAGSGAGVVAVDNDGDLSWSAGGSGANTALSNLAAVAINTSLISDADNTDDLGSSANGWKDIYSRRLLLDGATSGTSIIQSDALGNTLLGTILSGTGVIQTKFWARSTSDNTLANSTSDQACFAAAIDTWTLPANTLFWVEGEYIMTHGAVAHTVAVGFTLAGGASATNLSYSSLTFSANANAVTPTQVTAYITQTASTVSNQSGANAIEIIKFSGFISTNAAGTWQPIVKFNIDPTGTILFKAGSYITLTAMGTDTQQSQGPVN